MTFTCTECGLVHLSTRANNLIGYEIQEFSLPNGWVAPEHFKFETYCEAYNTFINMKPDKTQRRLYPTLKKD
jgi:hypothetical protein